MTETNFADVVVTRVKRLSNTVEGNPRYSFKTDRGTFRTRDNASENYTVPNDFAVNEEIMVEARLELTKSGKVIGWTLNS